MTALLFCGGSESFGECLATVYQPLSQAHAGTFYQKKTDRAPKQEPGEKDERQVPSSKGSNGLKVLCHRRRVGLAEMHDFGEVRLNVKELRNVNAIGDHSKNSKGKNVQCSANLSQRGQRRQDEPACEQQSDCLPIGVKNTDSQA